MLGTSRITEPPCSSIREYGRVMGEMLILFARILKTKGFGNSSDVVKEKKS